MALEPVRPADGVSFARVRPVGCGRVSRRAQSESDDGHEFGRDDESAIPEQRSTSESLVDNTVTRIMPIIAPWPDPGRPAHSAAGRGQRAGGVPPRRSGRSMYRPRPVRQSSSPRATPPTSSARDQPRSPRIPGRAATGHARRLEPGRTALAQMPSRRTWVVLVAVLIGLGAVIAVPFVLSSQPEAPLAVAVDGSPTALDEPPPGFVPSPAYLQSAAPSRPAPRRECRRLATPAPSPAAAPSQGQAASPTAQSTSPPDAPPFEPLTIEAESGTTTGSAHIWVDYVGVSGLNLVRNLGNWGGEPGTLTLSGIVFPSDGNYTITIYFVHPDGETNRSAQMTVSGVELVVTVEFVGDPNCCQVTEVNVAIPEGTRSITFANEVSHSPSIDKIVIARA